MSEYIVDVTGMESGDYAIAREEIVRCRDCRFSLAHGNGCCRNQDIYDVEPDGFCAWGERADNFATCKCGEDIETNGRESVTCPSCGRVVTE